MSKTLDKRAKEIILDAMDELEELTTESVMDLVRTYYMFDPEAAKEREIRRKANSLIAQLKDENGVRTCYNYEALGGQSMYVNIEKTKDLNALAGVNSQISAKFNGLFRAKKKIEKRIVELGGQMTIFDRAENY